MTAQTAKIISHTDKFQSAEQLWFWFVYSKQIRNDGLRRPGNQSGKRACELLDVETLVTKLYLAGKFTQGQLSVMKEFGDRKRAPHQHIWAENRKAALWRAAMQTLESAAKNKGWIY